MIAIPLHPLTRENFAPFGELLTLDDAEHFPINSGTTERYHALSKVDVTDQGGQPIISLFRGQAFHLPFQLRVMERHPLGSQTFIPVNAQPGSRYLVVVAAPCPANEPAIGAGMRAFIARGFEGVTYGKGVWHHPLISLDRDADFIVVDRQGSGNNCDEITLGAQYVVSSKTLEMA
jgi:ureidoglycolate lyase